MTATIALRFMGLQGTPDGEVTAMFTAMQEDTADNVTVIISALMSEAKWHALGRPDVTEIEIGSTV